MREPAASHSEREWILIGMAECCAAQGLETTAVADVCDAAGVSQESFEELFADLDECLGAAMELCVEEAWRALDGIASPQRPWEAELRDGVAALLGFLAERPAVTHLALVEAPAAGGRARALAAASRAALLAFLEEGPRRAEPEIPVHAARGALAGAEALAVHRVLTGKAAQLAEIVPDVVYMLAVPFLGVGEAGRLAQGASKRVHLRAVA